jgi:hypothetical protein
MVHAVIASIEVGDVELLIPATRDMVDRFPRVVGWRAGLALVYAEAGEVHKAAGETAWLRQANAISRPQRSEWFGTMGSLVFSAEALRDLTLASDLYEFLAPHRDHLAVIGFCSFCWGSTHHWLGILATLLERWEEARTHFNMALSVNEKVGARPWVARTEYDYSRMLNACGSPFKDIELHIERCIGIAQELGMHRLVRKAMNLKRALRATSEELIATGRQ